MFRFKYSLIFHISLLYSVIWNVAVSQSVINYNVDNGLPSDLVYRVSQDSTGFIWILTDKGIAKFNGSSFKTFTTKDGLPTNDIWDMKHTSDGRVWYFAKSDELGYIQNEKVLRFSGCDEDESYYPAILMRFRNTIIFNSHQGWYVLNNKCWRRLKPYSSVNSNVLMQDYLKEFESNIQEDLLTFYSYYDGLENKGVRKVENLRERVDDSINFWLFDGGYAAQNLENGKIIRKGFLNTYNSKYPNFTRSIFVNGSYQLTGFDFVSKLDSQYNLIEKTEIPKEFAAQFSMIDRQDNLWCASISNGLFFIPQAERKASYHLWNKRIKEAGKIGDHNFVWNNDEGYYIFDTISKEFRLKFPLKGLTQEATYIEDLSRCYFFADQQALITDKDLNIVNRTSNPGLRELVYHNQELYGISSGGIRLVDPLSLEVREFYPKVGVNKLISVGPKLYVGSTSGFNILENGQFKPLYFDGEYMDKPILSMEARKGGELLIGTDGYGLMIYNNNDIRTLKGTEGLRIEDITISDESLWLATDIGAIEFEVGSEMSIRRTLDRNSGLPSSKVRSISKIGDSLLIATAKAIAIIDADAVTRPALQHLYIEKIEYDNRDLKDNSSVLFAKNALLEIKVAGINYLPKPQALTYEYRLSPGDDTWTQSNSAAINFSRLSPDEYTLEIKSDGLLSVYNFSIEPLWWQRDLSIIGIGIALTLLIIFGLQQYRKRELKKKMSKLEIQNKLTEFELYALRSQMNPHFVFNSLAAIQYCINNKQVELAEKYLVKFSRLVRQFFEQSKKKEVDIESEVALLRNYLDIEKLRFKDKLEYSIRVSPELASKNPNIPTMLLQPIVENAINHGIFNKRNGGRVDIDFALMAEGMLKVEIADDGVGMAATAKPLNGKRNSSDVLNERIGFLNKSGNWEISYNDQPAFPEKQEQGNITTFLIKNET